MLDVLNSIYVFGRLHAERPAIVTPDMVITYGEFLSAVLSVEKRVAAINPDIEKPVAVVINDPARHLAVTLALAKLGYTTISPPRQLLPKAVELGTGAVVADEMMVTAPAKHVFARDDWFLEKSSLAHWRVSDAPENRIVRLALTSGSTGAAKVVAFTSSAMWARLLEMKDRLILGGERILLQFGLVSHVGYDAALAALTQGQTLFFARTASEAALLIRASAVDTIAASVLQLKDLVEAARRMCGPYAAFGSVRTVITGGSYLSMELLSELRRMFSGEVYQIYASTEAGSAAVVTGVMMEADAQTNRFVPLVDIRTLSDGQDDRVGVIGIRPRHMGRQFIGSLVDDPAKEPWFTPGDVGYLDRDGFLTVSGRVDDLINIGGVKRSVEVFEGHFRKAPGIRDCAIARVDTAKGPVFVLLVVCDREPNRAALADWGGQDNLHFAFHHLSRVAAIPRNSSDKIERERVRALAQTIVEAATN